MNRDIVWTNQFKKDYKLAQKRHLDVDLLDNIIRTLDNAKQTAPLSHDRESGAVFGVYILRFVTSADYYP